MIDRENAKYREGLMKGRVERDTEILVTLRNEANNEDFLEYVKTLLENHDKGITFTTS